MCEERRVGLLDLWAEAQLAWNYAERLEAQLEELKARASGGQ